MIETAALQHVGVFVANARKAADWYIDAMGFKEIGHFRTGGGQDVVFVRSDALGLTYELVQQPAGTAAAEEFANGPGRVDHLAFVVNDIESAFEEAKRRGEEIIEGIVDIPEFWERGFRYFLVKAAGGERVEFCTVL